MQVYLCTIFLLLNAPDFANGIDKVLISVLMVACNLMKVENKSLFWLRCQCGGRNVTAGMACSRSLCRQVDWEPLAILCLCCCPTGFWSPLGNALLRLPRLQGCIHLGKPGHAPKQSGALGFGATFQWLISLPWESGCYLCCFFFFVHLDIC